MHGVKHNMSLFFNGVSKMPICKPDDYSSHDNIQYIWSWYIS